MGGTTALVNLVRVINPPTYNLEVRKSILPIHDIPDPKAGSYLGLDDKTRNGIYMHSKKQTDLARIQGCQYEKVRGSRAVLDVQL